MRTRREVISPVPRSGSLETGDLLRPGCLKARRGRSVPVIRVFGIYLALSTDMKILTAALCVFDVMVVGYDLHQIISMASFWT